MFQGSRRVQRINTKLIYYSIYVVIIIKALFLFIVPDGIAEGNGSAASIFSDICKRVAAPTSDIPWGCRRVYLRGIEGYSCNYNFRSSWIYLSILSINPYFSCGYLTFQVGMMLAR